MSCTSGMLKALGMMLATLTLWACQTRAYAPLARASAVDIPRFMGPWYVIACIPNFIERNEYNAVESYHLDTDGRIRTVFTFNDGAFAGSRKRLTPVGFVTAGTRGTVWGMRFIWPIKADYRVMYVDADYSQTVIGREKRDYAWIMARSPTMPAADYRRLSMLLRSQGYDTNRLRKVPQQPRAVPES
jgi:apolipoprotein D and lipocalin family protein